MAEGNRVLAFVRRAFGFGDIPEPPAKVTESVGGYALFMDEDERVLLYAKEWPWVGVPHDDHTNSPIWAIDGQRFEPSRRDATGNWIFRRVRL